MKNQKLGRYFAAFMILNIVFEITAPSVALALTSGPMQEEFLNFEPAGTSEMVDLFTGDFKYNIPLMDVDGYPINIAYNGGQNMEGEASWVGLGWTLNPGALNRQMRGLPDDFNGETISNTTHYKPNYSTGVGYQISLLAAGSMGVSFKNTGIGATAFLSGQLSVGGMIGYNNYTGHFLEFQFEKSGQMGIGLGVLFWSPLSGSIGGGTGVKVNTHDGVTKTSYHSTGISHINFNKSLTLSNFFTNTSLFKTYSYGEGTSYNSRTGKKYNMYFSSQGSQSMLQQMNPFGTSTSRGSSHVIPTGPMSFSPKPNNSYFSRSYTSGKKLGLYGCIPIGIPFVVPKIEAGLFLGKHEYWSKSEIEDEIQNMPAYGYMYLENANDKSLMDFNRYKDGTFMEDAPNTAFSTLTNDNFAASGQGLAINFSSKRSDIGIVHDPRVKTRGNFNTDMKETGFGVFYYKQYNTISNVSIGTDGDWIGATLHNRLKFYSPDVTKTPDRYYEKTYFKVMGEKTPSEDLPSITSLSATKAGINNTGLSFDASGPVGGSASSPYVKKNTRVRKATNITYMNAAEASEIGYFKDVHEFPKNIFSINTSNRMMTGYSTTSKINVDGASAHHMSEVTVTKNDGAKYIYSTPVYNFEKRSYLFNVSDKKHAAGNPDNAPPDFDNTPLNKHKSLMMVEYEDDDRSQNNVRGKSKFYNEQITPAYASSFLLNAVLSNDYIDVRDDGPTNDDLGDYTLFNYTRANDYNWRDPYCVPTGHPGADNELTASSKQALLDIGLEADPFDDRASIEYGTKATWYVHSIETKNYVAEFEIDERADNRGVIDVDGALDASGSKSYYLKNIKLFTKEEKVRAAVTGLPPVPIKTVNFEYDYSLCKNVFNNVNTAGGYGAPNSGKLTLKKIYFTYGSSAKSALSPYEFIYADNNHDGAEDSNPDYDPRGTDRWGGFKPNAYLGYPYCNIDNPYSEQDQASRDNYAASWNLTSILTPSGARTDLYYESDDYGFVQNEPSAGMLRVANLLQSVSSGLVGQGLDIGSLSANTNITGNWCMIVDLEGLNKGIPTSVPFANADKIVKERVLPKKKELYFKAHLRVAHKNAYQNLIKDDYDNYVTGYAPIEVSGIFAKNANGSNTYVKNGIEYYKYAFATYEPSRIRTGNNSYKEVSPITYAGYDLVRTHLPALAFPGSDPTASNFYTSNAASKFSQMVRALAIAWKDHKRTIKDQPYKKFYKRGYCDEVHFDKFWVRAYTPYRKKLGGGYRVKKMITTDNWDGMVAGETSSSYGQTYSYIVYDANTKGYISSGVASYEPLVGGDENPMRQPKNFLFDNTLGKIKKSITLSPNDHYFQEEPYCEFLYPAPLVGYSKVTVKSIEHTYTNGQVTEEVCKLGRTEYEFFTAKEFPIMERKTSKDQQSIKTDPLDDHIVVPIVTSGIGVSQGFCVILNDMHGKMKRMAYFPEYNGNTTSASYEMAYEYKTLANFYNGSACLKVDDQIPMMDETLLVSTQTVGRNTEMTIDMRDSRNLSASLSINSIKKYSLCNPLGKRSSNIDFGIMDLSLSAINTTKVIQQFGILKSVKTTKEGVSSVVENMLWDKNTGAVLLTKTTNNSLQNNKVQNSVVMDLPVYNFNYPAYWGYKNLGPEFARDKIIFRASTKLPVNGGNWDAGTGQLDMAAVSNIVKEGDEVAVYDTLNNLIARRLWVVKQASPSPTKFYLMNENASIFNQVSFGMFYPNNKYLIKIIKPSEKNITSASMGEVLTLSDPRPAATFTNPGHRILNSSAVEYCEIWDYFSNTTAAQSNIAYPVNFDPIMYYNYAPPPSGIPVVNPYISASLGQWRPFRFYAYNVDRAYDGSLSNVKKDGTYASYTPFWKHTGSGVWQPTYNTSSGIDKWVKQQENNIYMPYGYLVQSTDAIGNKTSYRVGYNHSLPVIKAEKAGFHQIGFDGFEEYATQYGSFTANQIITNDYMGMAAQINNVISAGTSKPNLTSNASHTGRYSLQFNTGKTASFSGYYDASGNMIEQVNLQRCNLYAINKLNKLIMPRTKTNIVSFWVKGFTPATDYSNQFTATFRTSQAGPSFITAATISNVTATDIINGWQKFEYEVSWNAGGSGGPWNFEVLFSVPGGSSGFFLDDFRIHPYEANMNTLVYDPNTLRVWAQLDDRNFATIMEYDNEGVLVRTKKETLNGVYTIKEVRKSIQK